MMDNEQVRLIEPFAYKPGEPFRIFPIGKTFKRGKREITVTEAEAQEMAANYAAGRPRWQIPIYFGHEPASKDGPKQGNVKRLFVMPGDGLYAEPEYTPEGEQAVAQGAYQYVSPGVLWSKNGSGYTDEQGKAFDNVIDHVALTNRPFWGANTALFSADEAVAAQIESMADHSDAQFGAMRKAWKRAQELVSEFRALLEDWDKGLPENKRPAPDPRPASPAQAQGEDYAEDSTRGKAAQAQGAEDTGQAALPPTVSQQEETMTDMTNGQGTPAPEAMTLKPEEFAALKAQAEKAEQLEAKAQQLEQKVIQLAAQADKFAADAMTEKRTRRLGELTTRCEQFMAVATQPKEMAEKLLALEEKDAELYAYFMGVLENADTLVAKGELFGQKTSARGEATAETFEAVVEAELKANFGGDRKHYEAAMKAAQTKRPDLFARWYAEA